ncbi:MAG: PAS domain-containing protein [Terracidiphilus sp.]|nr:PAS domain-containing protein [Terracidiphilus sp.]MDR3799887.1 PAS domain-containing protein [Terracidiphilus sp.]
MKANSRAGSTPAARRQTLNPTRRAMLNIDHLPLPYVEMDARGIITRANRATLALHHPEQGELIGKSGWDLLAIDEKNRSTAAFLSLMSSGEGPPVILRSIFDRSGKFRTYEIHRSIIHATGGKPAGVRMIFMDVTERRNALEEAQRACQWLESALHSATDAVILTDALGVIRSINPAAERLCGWSANELTGMMIDELLPILACPSGDRTVLNLQAMLQLPCNGMAVVMTRERQQIEVGISTSPILDKNNGSVSGVSAVLQRVERSTKNRMSS